ncbi:hypothetical protein ACLOJK_000457 [Asimina triloba]
MACAAPNPPEKWTMCLTRGGADVVVGVDLFGLNPRMVSLYSLRLHLLVAGCFLLVFLVLSSYFLSEQTSSFAMEAINIGFIGAGKMAESIARGVAKSGVLPPSNLCTAHRTADRRDVFSSFGVRVYQHNTEVSYNPAAISCPADILLPRRIFICSTASDILLSGPQMNHLDQTTMAPVVDIKPTNQSQPYTVLESSNVVILSVKPQVVKKVLLELRPLLSKQKLLVSIAAGITIKDLQEWAGHGRLIRVMPNTPSAVEEAASVLLDTGSFFLQPADDVHDISNDQSNPTVSEELQQ